MSFQMTFWDTPNAISSPGSADGVRPCGLPAGQTIGRSGPGAVRVNLSPRQAAERGLLTSGTYGRRGTGSLSSANLRRSLASRLPASTGCDGSILYRMTWQDRVTPSGRRICALRASARRTSGNDFGSTLDGWPTASANEFGCCRDRLERRRDQCKRTADNGNGFGLNLSQAVTLHLTGWPTVTATDAIKQGVVSPRPGMMGLSETVSLVGPARWTASGEVLTGSSASMESGGQLNPEHARWLMGYPAAWGSCGATAMRSCRRSPRRSSVPSTRRAD